MKTIIMLRSTKAQKARLVMQLHSPMRRKSTAAPAFRSTLEVEHRFVPAAYLRSDVNGLWDHHHCVPLAPPSGQPTSLLRVSRLPDKIIRDTYFDIDDRLAKAGVWIRRKQERRSKSADCALILPGSEASMWEASSRLSSDYADSQSEEVVGLDGVTELLSNKMPAVALQNLEVTADLETFRRSWMVHCESANIITPAIQIVIDDVTEAAPGLRGVGSFQYSVGEVDLTADTSSTNLEEYSRLMEEMRKTLQSFMPTNGILFPMTPAPQGKLSAYFAWRELQGN